MAAAYADAPSLPKNAAGEATFTIRPQRPAIMPRSAARQQRAASAYAAAKGGLVALTKSLAREVARYGITVNAVSPGFVQTRLLAEADRAQREALEGQIPLGRFAEPDEVAAVIVFLASPAVSYLTGTTVHVDGGLTML